MQQAVLFSDVTLYLSRRSRTAKAERLRVMTHSVIDIPIGKILSISKKVATAAQWRHHHRK
jgi:hypothetical protein